ncbi:MAG: DNA-formamidopyrimidine glycosylase [Cyanobacteria bacterium]|nr:DNA-formamidopyrimidine glycosylase [Cyanobacteriota bacterium]
MPELPEVETVRRGLADTTVGWSLEGGEVLLDRAIAAPAPDRFLKHLTGCQIHQWHRRGKYLLGELRRQGGPGGWLGVHLRMTGQLRWLDRTAPLGPHDRVRLWTVQGSAARELRFSDIRTFGRLWWVPPGVEPATVITGLAKLGPEPFDGAFTGAYLKKSLAGRSRSLKAALLDQALVAGLGNIYVDEALFLSGLHPETPGAALTAAQGDRLRDTIRKVLTDSIAAGGTTFSDFISLTGVNGNYGGVAWVYRRTGQPCRVCGTAIARIKIAGRSSHFCPRCQLAPT